MDLADWTFLTIVTEGKVLEIDGTDVWWHDWQRLDIGTLEVPHPNYPHQRHTLRPYAIESCEDAILFCAGEVSNGVWCFHVPANGQPSRDGEGMTVNERLHASNLLDDFSQAIGARNETRATDILIAAGFDRRAATETVVATLENPEKYGFEGQGS